VTKYPHPYPFKQGNYYPYPIRIRENYGYPQNILNKVGCLAQFAECRSLAGHCARPAADGWPLCGRGYKPSATGQPTPPFILSGSI